MAAKLTLTLCAVHVTLTGAGVVIFNDVIHEIRSFIWQSTPSDATGWDYWARDLPISARWNTLLLPPTLGGLAVGLLRTISGGFDNPPDNAQQQQQPQPQSQAAEQSTSLTQNNSRAAAQPPSTTTSAARTQQSRASASKTSTSGANSGTDSSSRISSSQETSTSGSSTVWSLPWVTSGGRNLKRRLLRVARPFLKASAAAITLGTGNSLGPEGPSVEIGRAAARGLGTVLKSKQRRLLSLVAAGSGAGEPLDLLLSAPDMMVRVITAYCKALGHGVLYNVVVYCFVCSQ